MLNHKFPNHYSDSDLQMYAVYKDPTGKSVFNKSRPTESTSKGSLAMHTCTCTCIYMYNNNNFIIISTSSQCPKRFAKAEAEASILSNMVHCPKLPCSTGLLVIVG